MLTVVLSPVAMAQWEDTNGYYMWITYGAGSYQVGDDVDVVVHVFDMGLYANVDNVTLTVGDIFSGREVDVTEGATGKWSGTFTIEEDTWPPREGSTGARWRTPCPTSCWPTRRPATR